MSLKNILLRSINQKNKYLNLAATAVNLKNHKDYDYRDHRDRERSNKNYSRTIATVLFSSVLFKTAWAEKKKDEKVSFVAGEKLPNLPTYRASEVGQHDSKASVWVIYRHGVYDVTSFIPAHPGGDQIMNGAGFNIEPFWNFYGQHKTEENFRLLESFRIGNLHDDDVAEQSENDYWVKEPVRDTRLVVKTMKPFNAEIPPKLIVEHFDTPNEIFFVRQHMAVPELDPTKHKIRVIIKQPSKLGGSKTKEFSLKDLEKFPKVCVRAALMCAGNRRSEMSEGVPSKQVKGLKWTAGAISNAVWEGVLLRDVLECCGLDLDDTEGMHVIFTGADIDATGTKFAVSIPLEMAVNPDSRVMLATRMNGQPIPPDHGRPIRVVVPGAPAVRSVKWLDSITVGYEESNSHWHKEDYRSFNASQSWGTANFATAPPIYSLPVTSAICDPANEETVTVKDGFIEVRGYAFSGGGAKIVRVDVSPDEGNTWIEAENTHADDSPPRQHYAWTFWTAKIPVDPKQNELTLWAKATDSNFNTQPERFNDIWNIRGVLSNAYHRIKVQIKQ